MKYSLFSLQAAALLLVAKTASANTVGGDAAREFVAKFNDIIIYPLIILMAGIALLVFFYGAFEYVVRSDTDQGRDTGRRHMLWGIIGLLVMVSAVAILEIAAATFGVDKELQQFGP